MAEPFVDYLLTNDIDVREADRMVEWSFPPKVSIWTVRLTAQDTVWVICGDVPTDFIVLPGNPDPREVMIRICDRWDEVPRV